MTIGAFDTDSSALATRIRLQKSLSRFDLNEWIFARLQPDRGQRCLDLGCGRGEQTLPLAERVGAEGSVLAVDLSQESLHTVEALAAAKGLSTRVVTLRCNFADLGSTLADRKFDRILGSYSLYYSTDAEALFADIDAALADRGKLFFCGPARDNNMELRRIIATATGKPEAVTEPQRPAILMEELGPAICGRLFGHTELDHFENPISYTAADDLIAYWRSHNLFDPAAATAVEAAMRAWFEENREFVNTKRGIGVLAVK